LRTTGKGSETDAKVDVDDEGDKGRLLESDTGEDARDDAPEDSLVLEQLYAKAASRPRNADMRKSKSRPQQSFSEILKLK
jgi:hypothetical protein